MAFWVNEDRPYNSAIIHWDNCPYGVPHDKIRENGRWYGPYATEKEARRVARDTGRSEVRGCQICNP